MSARSGPADGVVSTANRRCLVTGEVKDKDALVRFVVGLEGELVPDVAGDLPGRGMWVSASREAVARAVAKGLFAKAARHKVRAPDDLAGRAEALLRQRCLELLGLARRAGQLVTGFEKVQAWLEAGKATVVVAASDGAVGGRAKISGAARGRPVIELFTGAELSLALGRENVVHAALAPGGIADRFVRESRRLAGLTT